MIQFKRHFGNAIWFSVGITLGGLILPQVVLSRAIHQRSAFFGLSRPPSIWGYPLSLCLPVFCGMDWFRSRGKNSRFPKDPAPQIFGGRIFD